jgi:ABC-type branched-subunit amino acid transport system substrate-binding protein
VNEKGETVKKGRLITAAAAASVLVLAACGSDNSSSSSGGATTAAASSATTAGGSSATTAAGGSASSAAATGAPINIGMLVPLTGPIALKGLSDNASLAVKQLNDAGGVAGHPVKITFYDTVDITPQNGRAAMQKALADHPTVLIGSNVSGQVAAATDLINQAGIPMINIGADNSTDPGQQNGSDWYFRLAMRADRIAKGMTDYVAQTLNAKNIVVGHSTDLTSTDDGGHMKKDAEAAGIKVSDTSWAPNATDLTNSALSTKGTDALMLAGYPAPQAQMIKTMRANGINIPVVANYGFATVVQNKLIPTDAFNNTVFLGNCEPIAEPPTNTAAKDYVAAMKAQYPGSYINGFYYDAVKVIAQGIQNAKGSLDPKDIKAGLAAIQNYAGACGTLSADSTQDFLHSMPVVDTSGAQETFKQEITGLTGDYS